MFNLVVKHLQLVESYPLIIQVTST